MEKMRFRSKHGEKVTISNKYREVSAQERMMEDGVGVSL